MGEIHNLSQPSVPRALNPVRRSLLVSLAVVAAIITGLLALHSLNLQTHASTEIAAAAAHHGAPQPGIGGGTAPSTACEDACGAQHSFTTMTACILALLVMGSVLLWVRPSFGWRPRIVWKVWQLENAAGLPPRTTPSLHALSISRT